MDTRSCLCDDVIVALWHMRWQSAFISDVSEDFDATAWPGLTLEMSEESSLKICNANFQVNGNPNFIGKSHPCTIICCLLIFSLQHNPFNLQIWITQACQDLINQYPNLSYPKRVSTTRCLYSQGILRKKMCTKCCKILTLVSCLSYRTFKALVRILFTSLTLLGGASRHSLFFGTFLGGWGRLKKHPVFDMTLYAKVWSERDLRKEGTRELYNFYFSHLNVK